MSKALVNLGLSETDAEVYVFLAVDGPHRGKSIAEALNLYKQQLYRSLKNLQSKGMVTATPEHPAHFSAVPFEKIIEHIIEAKAEQAKALQKSREELLASWRSMIKKEFADS